jgi:hypothetical protein
MKEKVVKSNGGNMKLRITAIVATICILAVVGIGLRAQSLTSHNIRYQRGMFILLTDDFLKINLANLDSSSHTYRVIVYGTVGGSSLSSISDSGSLTVSAGSGTHYDYPVTSGGNDYSVEITVDSDKVVPSASIFSGCTGGSCPSEGPRFWLGPGQFAKFKQEF